MSDYLVSPSQETSWRMEPDEFAERLRERFPDAEVQMLEDSEVAALRFVIPFQNGSELDGRFRRNGQVLAMDGGVEEGATVAAWFREIVPSDQELLFWDPGYHFHVPLADDTTRDEIIAAVEA